MKMTGKITNDGFKAVSGDHYMTGHHKIPRIWVVLADRHKFRVFMKPDGHLEQIAEACPQSLGKEKHASGHSAGDEGKFVKDIAVWLDEAVSADSFDKLILAASPKMLGDLRKFLSDAVQTRLIAEIDKDLIKMQEKELFEELKTIVWF